MWELEFICIIPGLKINSKLKETLENKCLSVWSIERIMAPKCHSNFIGMIMRLRPNGGVIWRLCCFESRMRNYLIEFLVAI